MTKSEVIKARFEPALKKEVERILAKLGLSASEAINLFYQEVKRRRGMPFNVSIPNRITIKNFQRHRCRKGLGSLPRRGGHVRKARSIAFFKQPTLR